MIDIRLSNNTQIPIYIQIKEQIRNLIATRVLLPGEHITTVRELSHTLHVNPATVARAYQELEQEGILGTHRRRGTIVTGGADDSRELVLRRNRLSSLVNSHILETLSLGYSPEELEADFALHLARWRIERQAQIPEETAQKVADRENVIVIVGSHDLALNLLIARLKHQRPEISVEVTNAGSLGGLLALQEGEADMAGIHLLDEDTGEYNYPYIKHVLQDIPVAIVHLVYRTQGIMFARGNPKKIVGLEDLRRPDVTFINRQKGAGTRVFLDYWLRQMGIAPEEVKGYNREVDTHLAAAMSITRGEADVTLGIEAAAHSCDVDFLPITKERFDLVIPEDVFRSEKMTALVAIIQSEEFKKVVAEMGGYDTSEMGTTTFIK